MEVCKNKANINLVKSEKIKYIALSPLLSLKLKALILLKSRDINDLFNITNDELQEFKNNFFDIDKLMEMGKPYVLDYLETTNQKDLLKFYLMGEEYTKVRTGLADNFDLNQIYGKLIQKTLMDSLDEKDINIRLKAIKTIKLTSRTTSVIDELSEIIKDIDL